MNELLMKIDDMKFMHLGTDFSMLGVGGDFLQAYTIWMKYLHFDMAILFSITSI